VKIAHALFAIFLTSAALAAEMHVEPLGPTSATPVEVHYLSICEARGGHSVTRDGSLIRVTALDPQCVIVLPIPMVEKVQLPELLPPGEYRAEVRLQGDTNIYAQTKFVVRNAGPKPFEVHPFAALAGGSANLQLRIVGMNCDQANCSDVTTVRVDGQPVPLLSTSDYTMKFIAPDHEAGLADVSVQKSDVVSVSPAAIYFFDDDDPSVFESVLFPVLFSADGAHGSQWRSEAVISNPRSWHIENANSIGPLHHCLTYPCGERLDPRSSVHLSDGFPRGAVLRVPRPETPDLAFALRIRDISRDAQTLGTRVPVVRERSMIHGEPIWLLDVPLDPRYRVKVRAYMIEPVLAPFLAGSIEFQHGQARVELPFTLTRSGPNEPYSAEIDLPQLSADDRVNVAVKLPLDATGWAFASVTNNETQQVTIVAPQ